MDTIVGNIGNKAKMSQKSKTHGAVLNSAVSGEIKHGGGLAQGHLNLALNGIKGAEGGIGFDSRDTHNGNVSDNSFRGFGTNIKINGSIPSIVGDENGRRVMGASEGGDRRRDGNGHQKHLIEISNSVRKTEMEAVWKTFELLGEDIRTLVERTDEQEDLLKTVFAVMDEEALEEVRELHREDSNSLVDKMIQHAENIREIKNIVRNETGMDKHESSNHNANWQPQSKRKQKNQNSPSITPSDDIRREDDVRREDLNVEPPTTETPTNENEQQQTDANRRQQQHEEHMRKLDEERRKFNIIIKGMEESFWGWEGDRANVESMLREMGLGHRRVEIKDIERIGRFHKGKRSRLLLVTFSTVSAAYEVHTKSYRLKNSYSFSKVYVRKDLTRAQREGVEGNGPRGEVDSSNGPRNDTPREPTTENPSSGNGTNVGNRGTAGNGESRRDREDTAANSGRNNVDTGVSTQGEGTDIASEVRANGEDTVIEGESNNRVGGGVRTRENVRSAPGNGSSKTRETAT